MSPLLWACLLMAVGLALVVIEMFIPSGGILGVLSAMAIVAGIVMAFQHGPWTGFGFTTASMVLIPAMIALLLNLWPKTSMGRRMLLNTPQGDELLPHIEQRQQLKALVGKLGKATTFMLPSGPVEIEGHTYDALSEGMAIDPEQSIRVVAVRGTSLVVRPADESPPQPDSDNPLQRPLESFGVDDDPLA